MNCSYIQAIKKEKKYKTVFFLKVKYFIDISIPLRLKSLNKNNGNKHCLLF